MSNKQNQGPDGIIAESKENITREKEIQEAVADNNVLVKVHMAKELAEKLGVSPSSIARILHLDQSFVEELIGHKLIEGENR